MTKISIIIPAWNLWHMTRQCLESLAQHTPKDAAEVVVVDNGSTDATVEALAPALHEFFGQQGVRVRHESNLGFAYGCNAGARAASGELLFFLNNDTVVTENWLPPLLTALQSPFVGMTGPLLLFPGSDLVQHCGIGCGPTLRVAHLYANFPGTHPMARKSRVLQALSGAALMLRKDLFWQCQGFHEGYVNGFEDLDLCFSVRRLGLRLLSVPQSVIYHHTSQTQGRFTHETSNAALLQQRCHEGFRPDIHTMALNDGYVPRLSSALELYLALPPVKEQALTQTLGQHWDADRCRARLQAEPLWQGGYNLLAQWLEQRGQWAEACAVRLRMSSFFPSPDNALALARAAQAGGFPDTVAQATAMAEELRAIAANSDALRQQALRLQQWSLKNGDQPLAQLFGQWLEGEQG